MNITGEKSFPSIKNVRKLVKELLNKKLRQQFFLFGLFSLFLVYLYLSVVEFSFFLFSRKMSFSVKSLTFLMTYLYMLGVF